MNIYRQQLTLIRSRTERMRPRRLIRCIHTGIGPLHAGRLRSPWQAPTMSTLVRRSTIMMAALAPIAALSLVTPTAGSAQPLDCQNGEWWDPVANVCQPPAAPAPAGMPERRLVGSCRQCVQAAARAVPAKLRGRTVLEPDFHRVSAAWPGLAGD